jgi:hypothetical protein
MPALGLGLRHALAASLVAALTASAGLARADEPAVTREPRLLSESAEVTSVADAFDKDDPFDFHIWVGFQQNWRRGEIRRETTLNQPGLSTGGFTAASENVAVYNQSQSILNVGADIGLFRDLALVFRLPIIAADSRSLSDLDGSSQNPQRFQDPTGAQLFTVPFKSPTRGGIDWFSVGLDWSPLSQQRDRTKPTWLVGLHGRFGVGTPLHACNADAPMGTPQCPDPANRTVNRDQGVSRAMYSLHARTMVSRRFGYVEPYTGFDFIADFTRPDSDMGRTNGYEGVVTRNAPMVGIFSLGTEVIPWEHRENFQRLVADFRVQGTYRSAGRDYSELFDALGSSSAPTLTRPAPSAWNAGPGNTSVPDPAAEKVYFTGVTDVAAHGGLRFSTQVTWQTGEYIKFNLGGSFEYLQSHAITGADACNPGSKEIGKSGPCRSTSASGETIVTGTPNPNYRDVIDAPGRRFVVDDTMIFGFWVNGVVMF